MKIRMKKCSLVLCVFVVWCVVLGAGRSPVAALFGALAATPLTIHAWNWLAPDRREENEPWEPIRNLNSPVSAVFSTRHGRQERLSAGPAGVNSFWNGRRRKGRIQSNPQILRSAVLKEETDALRSGERRSGEEGRA